MTVCFLNALRNAPRNTLRQEDLSASSGIRRIRGADGFSLFELLIVLVIVGTVAGVGINAFFFAPASLADAAHMVTREMELARSQALITHYPVVLQLNETSLSLTTGKEESRTAVQKDQAATVKERKPRITFLPAAVRVLSVNGVFVGEQPLKLIFHPQGIVQESFILLESRAREGSVRRVTLYIPSVGSAVIFEGLKDRDSIMKELF